MIELILCQCCVDIKCLVLFCITDMVKKSDDDDDCVCMEVSSTPALGNISSEIIICWDSCASLQFMTFCLISQLFCADILYILVLYCLEISIECHGELCIL